MSNIVRKHLNKHIGTSFEDFLKEEGLLKEVNAIALKIIMQKQAKKSISRNEQTLRRHNSF